MKHVSVMLKEAVDCLDIQNGDTVIDGTLGAAGHTQEICKRFGDKVKVIGMDLDQDAIHHAQAKFAESDCRIRFYKENFKNMDKVLEIEKIKGVDGVLLDLGYSSDQLESAGRGFSFKKSEPLKMTLKKEITESEFDAQDILNDWDEEDIANVIYAYGDERFARSIARKIVEFRELNPIKTTADLVGIIESAVPFFYRRSRIHSATKTFQALRIAVNDELENLKIALEKGFETLLPGGRFVIITFHSLEDRIVKNFFREKDKEGKGELLYKKPLIPSIEEQTENPRSRSAKLRVIKKI